MSEIPVFRYQFDPSKLTKIQVNNQVQRVKAILFPQKGVVENNYGLISLLRYQYGLQTKITQTIFMINDFVDAQNAYLLDDDTTARKLFEDYHRGLNNLTGLNYNPAVAVVLELQRLDQSILTGMESVQAEQALCEHMYSLPTGACNDAFGPDYASRALAPDLAVVNKNNRKDAFRHYEAVYLAHYQALLNAIIEAESSSN